jgi:tetratricopeptide (TPR) repeat protein
MLVALLILLSGTEEAQGPSTCGQRADSIIAMVTSSPTAAVSLARRLGRECRHEFNALFTAGRALNRVARFKEAKEDHVLREIAGRLLDRAVQLRPRNAAAWFEFGLAIKKRGGLQVDAIRAIQRSWELADRFPDSTPPSLLAEIQFQRARYKQDWVDRHRWLKDGRNLAVVTPACSNLGLFCENYTHPAHFNERLRDAPPVSFNLGPHRDDLIALYWKVLTLNPLHPEATERLAREYVLAEEWELLEDLARRVQRSTGGSPFFGAVEALSVTRRGRLQVADSLFRRAIAAMPDSLRRRYLQPPTPLDTVTDFWNRGRPLWLVPFNELRLEYWTRLTLAFLVMRDREAEVQGPETPQGDALVRYGWPNAIALIDRNASVLLTPDQLARVIATSLDCAGGADVGVRDQGLPTCGQFDPGYNTDPGGGRWILWTYDLNRPSMVFEQRPGLRVPRYVFSGAAEQYAADLRRETPLAFRPRVTPRQYHLPAQVARFRGSQPEETAVLLYSVVPSRQMELPPQDSVDVGLFLFRDSVGFTRVAERRGSYPAGEGISLSYQVPLAAGRYAYSLEALVAGYGAAATARDTVTAPVWTPESLLVSDLLVAHQVTPRVEGEPVALRDLTVVPSRTLEVTPGSRLWVVWEVYGAAADRRGLGRYDVSLTLADTERRSLPLRLLRRLGVGGGEESQAVRLAWTAERRLAADGRALEYVEIELPAEARGEYRLEVAVRAGDRAAAVGRRLTVVSPAAEPNP